MHEYSIIRALIDRVETEAKARGATSIRRIQVRIGELAGVEKDFLLSAYEVFRERTLCREAALQITPVEARWACPSCGASIPRGEILRCGKCGLPARLAGGDEILLDRIEMEVP
jgi:hydrogenase nickel incorporation protein HypA/HybF